MRSGNHLFRPIFLFFIFCRQEVVNVLLGIDVCLIPIRFRYCTSATCSSNSVGTLILWFNKRNNSSWPNSLAFGTPLESIITYLKAIIIRSVAYPYVFGSITIMTCPWFYPETRFRSHFNKVLFFTNTMCITIKNIISQASDYCQIILTIYSIYIYLHRKFYFRNQHSHRLNLSTHNDNQIDVIAYKKSPLRFVLCGFFSWFFLGIIYTEIVGK